MPWGMSIVLVAPALSWSIRAGRDQMKIVQERVRVGARDIIDHFLDEGTFRSWDAAALRIPANAEYAEMLRAARASTGLDESVITGEGTLRGRRVAVIAGEFAFLGGSIGVAAT